jgi:hypothetical protein
MADERRKQFIIYENLFSFLFCSIVTQLHMKISKSKHHSHKGGNLELRGNSFPAEWRSVF